jgi:hypothetical protein
MHLQDDKVMFEIRILNSNLPIFAGNNAEAFAFSIDLRLFVRELTTMSWKTVN